MISNPSQRRRRAQFVTKSAGDEIIEGEGDVSVADAFFNENVVSELGKPQVSSFQAPAGSMEIKETSISKSGAMNKVTSAVGAKGIPQIAYFCIGAIAGVLLATLMVTYFLIRRRKSWTSQRHRQRRHERTTIQTWTNEIKFHDECDSTDEEVWDDLEEVYHIKDYNVTHPHAPIDALASTKFGASSSFDSNDEGDWLEGVGFGHDKKSIDVENVNNFKFDTDHGSESSEYEEESNGSIGEILNGDCSHSTHSTSPSSDSSGLPSWSPPSSPTVDVLPKVLFSPPTVTELFESTVSPITSRRRFPLPPKASEVTFEELQKEQEQLNKSLFMLNDQLLGHQREREIVSQNMEQKTTRRKHRDNCQKLEKITEEIALLEGEKEEVDKKLKENQSKVKTLRLEHRRKKFLTP